LCVYARFYYQWNQHNDECQLYIMTLAAYVGFLVPAILSSGFIISIFAVVPKAALVGLLLSDLLHLAFQGPWQEESRRERVGDEEVGSLLDADESEKVVFSTPEDVPMDVSCIKATPQRPSLYITSEDALRGQTHTYHYCHHTTTTTTTITTVE
jgi:hypothetical protein